MIAILLVITLVGCGTDPSAHPGGLQATSSNLISEYTFQEDTSDCRNAENKLGYNTEVGECTDFQELTPDQIQNINFQSENLIGSNVADVDLTGTSVDAVYIVENSLNYSNNTIVSDGKLIEEIDMLKVVKDFCSKTKKGKGLKKGLLKKCAN